MGTALLIDGVNWKSSGGMPDHFHVSAATVSRPQHPLFKTAHWLYDRVGKFAKLKEGAGVAGKLASFCGLIVLIAVLSGCADRGGGSTPGAANGSPAVAASARKPYAVGQAMINDAHQSVTVTAFKRGVSTGNELLSPAAGKECVQTDVALVNGDSTSWSLPLYEMAVVDANGQSYSASFSCGGDSSTIEALIPHGKATASIRFEVPTGGALLFTWTPSALNPNSTYQTDLK